MCNGNKLSRGSCDEINVNERARYVYRLSRKHVIYG